jgi:hypothetical protein
VGDGGTTRACLCLLLRHRLLAEFGGGEVESNRQSRGHRSLIPSLYILREAKLLNYGIVEGQESSNTKKDLVTFQTLIHVSM